MALQGTIDSFALDDVLRLLGASSKTGRLIVNGDRGSAHLWLVEGRLVGGDTSGEPGRELVEVIFDVLRYQSGSFIFEADTPCPSPSAPLDVEPALVDACAALDEWREIIAIVPSLDAMVTLTAELPHPEVVIDQPCWTSIVTIGGGCTVGQLGATFGLGELPVSRLVRALHIAGFVEISGAVTSAAPVGDAGPVESWFTEDRPLDEAASFDGLASPDGSAASDGLTRLEPVAPWADAPAPDEAGRDELDAWASPFEADDHRFGDGETVFGDPAFAAAIAADLGAEPGPEHPSGDVDGEYGEAPATLDEALPPVPDAEELSRQMSMLSPKAAQAVAAAAAQADHSDS